MTLEQGGFSQERTHNTPEKKRGFITIPEEMKALSREVVGVPWSIEVAYAKGDEETKEKIRERLTQLQEKYNSRMNPVGGAYITLVSGFLAGTGPIIFSQAQFMAEHPEIFEKLERHSEQALVAGTASGVLAIAILAVGSTYAWIAREQGKKQLAKELV